MTHAPHSYKRVEEIENQLARLNEADEAQRVIAARTRDPQILTEVRRTRTELAKAIAQLQRERQAVKK